MNYSEGYTPCSDMNELFEKWKQVHETQESCNCIPKDSENLKRTIAADSFGRDGIINEETYKQADLKVLYLCKEENLGSDNEKSGCTIRQKGEDPLQRIQEYSIGCKISGGTNMYGKLQGMQNRIVKTEGSKMQGRKILQEIAFMNINKRGGFKKCDESALIKYAKTHKNYIQNEIALIDPDVIICGGCYHIIKELFDLEDEETYPESFDKRKKYSYLKVREDHKSLVIDYYHPSYCFPYEGDSEKVSFKDVTELIYKEKQRKC